MKAVAEKLENNRVSLQIEVEAEKVDAALDRAYKKIVRQVNIPGFRKGRVPRAIIEKRFGKEALYEDALDELIPEAYEKAVAEQELEPIDQPSLTDFTIEPGKPALLTMEVEVVPEVKLGDYKGLQAERVIEQVDTSDIDHMLEHLLDDHTTLEPTERTVVQEDDFVEIDYEGKIDGVPFQGGAAKGQMLQVGSGQFIPGFEEQLIGAVVGEPVEVNVTFPQDYTEDLQGKDAVFEVLVNSIKVRNVPELNDEFAEQSSDGKFKTMLDLRASIRTDMEKDARERAEQQMRRDLVKAITEASEVDVPSILVDREIKSRLNRFEQDIAQRGATIEQYLEYTGMTREDLEKDLEDDAQFAVRSELVLSAIAKKEGIVISDDELKAEIDKMIEESEYPGLMRQLLNDDVRENYRDNLRLARATDLLVEHAEIEEKEIPSQGHGHAHHVHDEDEDHDDDHRDDDEQAQDEDQPLDTSEDA